MVKLKCKSVQRDDYTELGFGVEALLYGIAKARGVAAKIVLPHEHRQWEYASAIQAFREHFGEVLEEEKTLLDLGCGYASPLGPALSFAYPNLSIMENDVEDRAFAHRAHLWKSLARPLPTGFAKQDLAVVDRPSDCVTCISVMEHIKSDLQESSWKNVCRNVKPGGLLAVTVDYGEDKSKGWTYDADREVKYTSEDIERLVSLLKEEGFELPEVDLTFHGPEVWDYTFFRLFAWRP